jgi:L,D-transpeptidase catalytic domain/Putative peptidoglycan binding domain
MRVRAALIAAVVGVLLLAGAGAVFAYDRAHSEEIGRGVRVGGVDVSGLSPEEARAKLQSAVAEPLSRPVVVRARGKRYTLTPERARVVVDIDGSVNDALERSRDGGILTRTLRGLRGQSLDAELELDIDYSKRSIKRLVKRVGEAVDEPAVDASVDLEHGDLTPHESQDGRRLLAKKLKRQVRKRLLDVGDDKSVRAKIEVVKPEVTTDELAEKYPAVVFVNRGGFQLSLYKNLKLAKTYGIAVGQLGLETPAGLYHIQNKAVNPAWSVPNSAWAGSLAGTVVPGGTPQNPLKARWLGIYDGAGIHGTDATGSIGTAASHGCIRMLIPDVIELYDQVPVGAPIYIA